MILWSLGAACRAAEEPSEGSGWWAVTSHERGHPACCWAATRSTLPAISCKRLLSLAAGLPEHSDPMLLWGTASLRGASGASNALRGISIKENHSAREIKGENAMELPSAAPQCHHKDLLPQPRSGWVLDLWTKATTSAAIVTSWAGSSPGEGQQRVET